MAYQRYRRRRKNYAKRDSIDSAIREGDLVLGDQFTSALTLTQGSERSVMSVAGVSGKTTVLPYWWMKFFHQSSATSLVMEYFLVKYVTADGVPDLSNATVREKLTRDGRIYWRTIVLQDKSSLRCAKLVSFRKSKLTIREDETIALIAIEFGPTTAADVVEFYRSELRYLQV